eukprot:GEMP01009997.1.p1 GENE.GEMP01009997.1~~GEMP01009997.1.p1  ORF type:complete len:390 (+),score=67.18 GEMP01009997.1:103-1272(+)
MVASANALPAVDEKWQLAPLKAARQGWLGQTHTSDGKSKFDFSLQSGTQTVNAVFLPNLGSMQRASTPWQYNTPIRTVELSKDAEESKSRCLKKLRYLRQPMPSNYIRRIRRKVQQSTSDPINAKDYVQDLMFIAESASRAGHIDSAAQAYHKMGVALDNMGKFKEANDNYHQCLALCVSSKNQQGEALAYNCLGINNYKIGRYEEAIKCHNKHLELADPAGRLLAHTNLGVVFDEMNLHDHAAIHHQHAIEYANRVHATDAQTLAVGNLGISALHQGDPETSRACLQYHMSMAERAENPEGCTKFTKLARSAAENEAHHKLGEVSINEGKLEEAATHFALAVDLARKLKDHTMEQKSSVMLGVSQGLMHFDNHRRTLLEAAQPSLLAM